MTEPAETLTTWRSRPVFISSTFRDMHAERDHLRNHVFPELEDRLRERRHYLEPIDLRQGVETATLAEERARDLQVLKVCLNEIERSRPFLLVLLGDRYGWEPPEDRIAAAAQEAGLDTEAAGKSVTALEIEFGLLKKDPAQRRRSLFYFREPLPYAAMPKAVAAEYSDDYADDPAIRAGHERLNALKQAIRDDPELAGRVRPYALGWDAKAQQPTGLEAWGRQVLEALWTELKEETRAYLAQAPTTEAGQDRAMLDEFVEHKLRDFRGRAATLRPLVDLARSPAAPGAPWAACLTGPSGSGKSTVFARLYRELVRDKGLFVLAHAAGSGPRTARVETMLRRWCEELAPHLGERSPLTDTTDREEIEQTFARLLHRVAGQRRVVVLLDALNQFEPTPQARHLTWIPKLWPDNARLIATALPGAEAEALGAKPRVTVMTLPALDEAEARDIAESIWASYHRACNPDVLNRVLDLRRDDGQPAYRNPLWLTLVMEQLNLLDADDFTAAGQNLHQLLLRKATELPPEVSGLYREMLSRAEKLFGAAWARSFVALIALSQNGWRESDLQALLAPAARLLAPDDPSPEWDALRFAALRRTFRAQVMQRGSHGRWDFSHAQMRAAVAANFLADAALTRRLHSAINDYLETQPPDDPIIPLERMRQLLGEGNALRAARYYATVDASGTDENTDEKIGATSTLVDWIVAGQAEDGLNPNLDGITGWLREPGLTHDEVYRLTYNFQFGLLERMENDMTLPTCQRLIEAVRSALEALTAANPSNPLWQNDLAVSHRKVGDMQRSQGDLAGARQAYGASLVTFERMAVFDPSHAGVQNNLAMSQAKDGDMLRVQGDLAGALQAYRASLAIAERLVADDPSHVGWQNTLAAIHGKVGDMLRDQGDLAGALQAYRASLATFERVVAADPCCVGWQHNLAASQRRVGDVRRDQGDLAGALQAYRASVAIAERLTGADPSHAGWQNNLAMGQIKVGDVLRNQGDLSGALQACRASLAIRERLAAVDSSHVGWQSDLAASHDRVGDVRRDQGDLSGALQAYRASLAIAERLAAADPSHAGWQNNLAMGQIKVGDVLRNQGDLSGALQACRASLAIFERLAAAEPSNAQWQNNLAVSQAEVGNLLRDQGDLAGALQAYRASLAIAERLVAVDPSNTQWQRELAASQRRVGNMLRNLGDPSRALRAYRASLAIAERLARADPSNAQWQHDLAESHEEVGGVLRNQGDLSGALQAYRTSLAIFERLAAADQSHLGWQNTLAVSHSKIGDVLRERGDLAGALQAYRATLSLHERLAAAEPSHVGWQYNLAVSQTKVGDVRQDQGDLAGALSAYRASLAIEEQLTVADPTHVGGQNNLMVSQAKVGDVLRNQGDLAGALQTYRGSLAIAKRLAAADPSNAQSQHGLSMSHSKVGDVLRDQGDLAGALSAYRASLAIAEQLAVADPTHFGWQNNLAVSHSKVGDVLRDQNDLAGAIQAYRANHVIIERLAAADPSHVGWQNNLMVSQAKVGDVLRDQGDLAGALQAYRASLAIAERLAAADSLNAGWQNNLAVSQAKVGGLLRDQGDLAGALQSYRASLAIRERLAAIDPANAGWQRDLWVSCYNLGLALELSHDPAARDYTRRACNILSSMQERGLHLSPNDRQFLEQLRAELKEPDPYAPAHPPIAHPNSKADEAQRMNLAYQTQYAAWEALPWWKRWFTPEPQPPEGI